VLLLQQLTRISYQMVLRCETTRLYRRAHGRTTTQSLLKLKSPNSLMNPMMKSCYLKSADSFVRRSNPSMQCWMHWMWINQGSLRILSSEMLLRHWILDSHRQKLIYYWMSARSMAELISNSLRSSSHSRKNQRDTEREYVCIKLPLILTVCYIFSSHNS